MKTKIFSKLRAKIIIAISTVSAVILLISSILIYSFAAKNITAEKYIPDSAPEYNSEIINIIKERVDDDRQNIIEKIFLTIIFTDISIECLTIFLAIIFADKITRPVEDSYEAQKNFIANASHELKTPIAAIQANLEAAEIKGNHWIENVEYETEKLAGLNSELLTLSRLDIVNEKIINEEFDLRDIILENLNPLLPRLDGRQITLIGKSTKIKSNKKHLAEILNILFDNAAKYSEKEITIYYDSKNIEIENDGKTIPKEKLSHIFDRFYQVDKNSEGVGLGLSIAKALSEKNNWKIEAKSQNQKTKFKLML